MVLHGLIQRDETAKFADEPTKARWSDFSSLFAISITVICFSRRTSSRRGSHDWKRGLSLSTYERPENAAKSMLSRGGRMLKRQGSKLNLGSFLAEEGIEEAAMEISETCRRPQLSQKRSKALGNKSFFPLF